MRTGHRFASQVVAEKSTAVEPQAQQNLNSTAPPPRHDLGDRSVRKDPPVLLIGVLSIIAIPPLIYYYWKYRDAHMRAKKQAILQDMQARAANGP